MDWVFEIKSSVGDSPVAVKAPKGVARKDGPECIQFLFIMAGNYGEAQSVKCGEIQSQPSLCFLSF